MGTYYTSDKKYCVKDLLGTIAKENATQEEILDILRKLVDEKDTEETILKKINDTTFDTLMLQPHRFGVDINFNGFLRKLSELIKKKKKI